MDFISFETAFETWVHLVVIENINTYTNGNKIQFTFGELIF